MKAAVKGKRVRRDEAQWRGLVTEHERSGLSQAAFCEREGLCAQSLSNWRRRLGSSIEAATTEPALSFLEIGRSHAKPLDGAGVRVRVELGAGIVLEISRA
jgi:transposase-like protein